MGYRFIDNNGTFELENADASSYLYFPLCNEAGLMGCVTPRSGGDLMLDQNRFILQPTSVSDLHNNKSSRNFWLRFEDGSLRSATGASVWQRAEEAAPADERYPDRKDPANAGISKGIKLRAGLLWQESTTVIRCGKSLIEAAVLNFIPADKTMAQVMRVRLKNIGDTETAFEPVAVIPMYGRSAVNLRDHRHVTSLLHRISTEKYGVRIKPTLSFDERGHLKNHTEYFTLGCDGQGKAPVAFLPTADHVIGEGGDFECPKGLMQDCRKTRGCCNDNGVEEYANTEMSGSGVAVGKTFEGVEAAGGLIFEKCCLTSGESAEYIVFIGAREEDDPFNAPDAIMERLGNSQKIENALEANKAFWLEKARAGLGMKEKAVPDRLSSDLSDEGSATLSSKRQNFMLWVAAEPVLRRIFGCSFLPYHDYGKGGRGWRDLWQDCLALMLADPSDVRDLLINNFAGVRADGTNATIIGSRPGEFIADRNGIARVWMDHGVWPWITMQLYIELSHDTGILATEQVYFKDRLCKRARDVDDEDGRPDAESDNSCRSGNEEDNSKTLLRDSEGKVYRGTLLEHILLMHITAACDVGEHGNMLLRGADWNDALDMADRRGESVAFTAAYAGNMKTLAKTVAEMGGKVSLLAELFELIGGLYEICKNFPETNGRKQQESKAFGTGTVAACAEQKRALLDVYCEKVRHTVSGKTIETESAVLAEMLDFIAESIMTDIRENEMLSFGDLKWFNGYYDNEGERVENLEDGRLMLTGAVFTLMSGTAPDEIIDSMIGAADRYLLQNRIGGYRLNTRFENEEAYAHKLGRMFGFAYGSKENGAVFCHMAVMYAYALLLRGRKEAAEKVIDLLIGQSMDFEKARIYPGIPEYFDINGRGMYPYLTGAASWLLLYHYRVGK